MSEEKQLTAEELQQQLNRQFYISNNLQQQIANAAAQNAQNKALDQLIIKELHEEKEQLKNNFDFLAEEYNKALDTMKELKEDLEGTAAELRQLKAKYAGPVPVSEEPAPEDQPENTEA